MLDVILAVLGNGRKELLAQTVESLNKNVDYPFIKKIMIDDTVDMAYSNYLHDTYGHEWHIISHITKRGLSGSIQSLWSAARSLGAGYIFHVEEDFLFLQPVPMTEMLEMLNRDVFTGIAQVALKRQPCNVDEIEAGGFMQLAPDSYLEIDMNGYDPDTKEKIIRYSFVAHRNFFTLNPSLYPRWVMDLGWEDGWGEKEFAERLFQHENVVCAYMGTVDDPELVFHTGHYRAENWTL